ncbi:MAG: hypothetical protein ABWW69_04470 [Pyrodictiaceae archaeon]
MPSILVIKGIGAKSRDAERLVREAIAKSFKNMRKISEFPNVSIVSIPFMDEELGLPWILIDGMEVGIENIEDVARYADSNYADTISITSVMGKEKLLVMEA